MLFLSKRFRYLLSFLDFLLNFYLGLVVFHLHCIDLIKYHGEYILKDNFCVHFEGAVKLTVKNGLISCISDSF